MNSRRNNWSDIRVVKSNSSSRVTSILMFFIMFGSSWAPDPRPVFHALSPYASAYAPCHRRALRTTDEYRPSAFERLTEHSIEMDKSRLCVTAIHCLDCDP